MHKMSGIPGYSWAVLLSSCGDKLRTQFMEILASLDSSTMFESGGQNVEHLLLCVSTEYLGTYVFVGRQTYSVVGYKVLLRILVRLCKTRVAS